MRATQRGAITVARITRWKGATIEIMRRANKAITSWRARSNGDEGQEALAVPQPDKGQTSYAGGGM
jgi:hypothetical protein